MMGLVLIRVTVLPSGSQELLQIITIIMLIYILSKIVILGLLNMGKVTGILSVLCIADIESSIAHYIVLDSKLDILPIPVALRNCWHVRQDWHTGMP